MKIIADTTILVRFLVNDDPKQFEAACRLIKKSVEIIIPTAVFCELVWVLGRSYQHPLADIAEKIEMLVASKGTTVHEDEVAAGVRMMRGGGDFADGVHAYTGRQMAGRGAVFVSFDRHAVRVLAEQGQAALIPE